MSIPLEVLAQQVLQLPISDRAKLLDQVVNSLDSDKERDAKWDDVAAQRDAEAEADPTQLVPGSEALACVRAGVR